MRDAKTWTTSQVRELAEMLETGEDWSRIAEVLCRSKNACVHQAHRLWPTVRKGTPHRPAVMEMADGTFRAWTKRDEREAVDMRSRGLTIVAIAERLRRRRDAVEMKLYLMGVCARPEVPKKRPRRKSESERLVAEAPPKRTSVIPCLQCRRPFRSEGPHNRRCDACRRTSVSPFEDATLNK